MGLTDLFRRGRSTVVLGPRQFSLAVAGHGIECRPRLPCSAAHLADGSLVFGPFDPAGARASGPIKTALIKPGTPPSGTLEKRAISANSIVTYSTAQRGSTQLVLSLGMTGFDDVLETFRTGPVQGAWKIVTDNHEIVWPTKLALRAHGDLSSDGGYTLALDGSTVNVIHLYGPLHGEKIPPPEMLNATNQSQLDAGSLDGTVRAVKHYTFEGDGSAQRYYYAHLDSAVIYLIRARATLDDAKLLFAAADQVASSLAPRF